MQGNITFSTPHEVSVVSSGFYVSRHVASRPGHPASPGVATRVNRLWWASALVAAKSDDAVLGQPQKHEKGAEGTRHVFDSTFAALFIPAP